MTDHASSSSNMPSREVCVLRYVLEKRAAMQPEATFAVFEDGVRWTLADTLEQARTTAAGLQALGVRRQDTVLMLLPNNAVGVRCLFGANYLGAIAVPVNPAYKGRLLQHVLVNCAAQVAVVHPDVLPEILSVDTGSLHTIVVAAADLPDVRIPAGLTLLTQDALVGDAAALDTPTPPIEPWDTQTIIYTSGTTGPSKGVLSSYMHSYSTVGAHAWSHVRDTDRHLVHMPLFHIGGAFMCFLAIYRGGSIAVVSGFRTADFWQTVARLQVTCAFLLGAMATFLLKQPATAFDRSHGLRLAFIVPLGDQSSRFRERFGVDICTIFNMTEISTPLGSELNPSKANTCGRPRHGVEVRLVDTNDIEVPPGEIGELVVRTALPWAMNHGYNANPDATAKAWRNGWFHTGDAFRRDAEGDYFFVDRLKDMIRRRGENISAYEIELEVCSHPAVQEAAAVAVPSDISEDEVLLAIVLRPDAELAPEALLAYLAERLPHFMLPRYVRHLSDLPKTETAKVRKQVLRLDGITPDTWDRQAAGIQIRSRRFN